MNFIQYTYPLITFSIVSGLLNFSINWGYINKILYFYLI